MKKIAKILITVLFLSAIFGSNAYAQKLPFVRVFDLNGHKIGSGRVVAVTDSTLQLKGSSFNYRLSSIGRIKIKRSADHNILVATSIGAITGGILAYATYSKSASGFIFDRNGAAVLGAMFGGFSVGVITGIISGVSAIFKPHKTFQIDGNPTKWKTFQNFIATGK